LGLEELSFGVFELDLELDFKGYLKINTEFFELSSELSFLILI